MGIACNAQNTEPNLDFTKINASSNTSTFEAMANKANVDVEPYFIDIKVVKTELGRDALELYVVLNGGSFFVSPMSNDRFRGRFKVDLEENDALALDSNFIEIPQSVKEYDPHPFVKGFVYWVTKNTRYQYNLITKNSDDFEVSGNVGFTIEPKCTYERIKFTITRKNGVYSVEYKKTGC